MTTGGDSSASRLTTTTGCAEETLGKQLVRMVVGLGAASGTSSTGSISESQARISRRTFLRFLVDTVHQLQLTAVQAEKAITEMEHWRTCPQLHFHQRPVQIGNFRKQLDGLQLQLVQLVSDISTARDRLEQLIDDGVIRESTLLRPQPKKYTTGRMRAEVWDMECQLLILRTSFDTAQATWRQRFCPTDLKLKRKEVQYNTGK